AACYLAKAGWKPLLLERRQTVGGIAVTEPLHPGFRCPTLAHSTGPCLPSIASDLGLERHGLEILRPGVRVFAPSTDGRALLLFDDPARTTAGLKELSARDAEAFPRFHQSLGRIGKLLSRLLLMTPPSIEKLRLPEIFNLIGLGRAFRGLPKRDAYRLLRWGPMAVADLVSEYFETELLRASIAVRGIRGMFAGPWSAGTGANLLLAAAADGHSAGPAAFVRGGPGALTQALLSAAREAGAELRTGAEVSRIAIADGAVAGVVLASGEEISVRTVVSNADPKRTLLGLVDPEHLDPDFLQKIHNYRSAGAIAKVNVALSGLPGFSAFERKREGSEALTLLSGRIHIGPDIDYLERAFDAAKYGEPSPAPCLEVTIPSAGDPSLAPPGRHVMSVLAQFAPYRLKGDGWKTRGEAFADTVIETLSRYAPNLPDLILHRQVITPQDLEETYGLTEGHMFHGEPSLDQLFAMRPLLDWAQYRTPIRRLYLCGSGTHPGPGVTGASGANAAREIMKDLRRARA
ncbi:MAG TPA: NAD(P)/FAD-dependent oxidoreductase, partial [Thermoanaerobaculia bacterium]|nr:NAD(P)/FAD-dependent oxidoreductase [Thermoanaerobaculia bacterium]